MAVSFGGDEIFGTAAFSAIMGAGLAELEAPRPGADRRLHLTRLADGIGVAAENVSLALGDTGGSPGARGPPLPA